MSQPKGLYTKSQRDKAKAEGLKLCAIDTPHVSFAGPATQEEHDEIVRFLNEFLKRRFDRIRAERQAKEAGQ